ncbi:hypothetical protein PHMEG_00034242 [Phytophthora megakarya]|uniref:Uncharacterized protein n=1 Tax=Phytophthora megakarya TaxID=4795 RepID=A0A225UU12_9STRA|nr:hypothetical protein PHMEG_00034242 [Phytophthora megakarya]
MSNSDESPRASDAGGTLYRSYAASDYSSDESTRELSPDDFFPNRCTVCATGFERPSIPPRPSVQVPAVGDPIPSVDALEQDVTALEQDAHVLRSRLELTTALNTGLAAHASVLHEGLDVLRDRAREGYNIGLDAVERLSREVETRHQTLREFRDEYGPNIFSSDNSRVFNSGCVASLVSEAATQTDIASVSSNLSTAATSQIDLSGDEVSRSIAGLSSLEASVTALRAQIGSLTRERDSALAASIRHHD